MLGAVFFFLVTFYAPRRYLSYHLIRKIHIAVSKSDGRASKYISFFFTLMTARYMARLILILYCLALIFKTIIDTIFIFDYINI